MALKEISPILCLNTFLLYEADEQEEKVGAPSREECLQLILYWSRHYSSILLTAFAHSKIEGGQGAKCGWKHRINLLWTLLGFFQKCINFTKIRHRERSPDSTAKSQTSEEKEEQRTHTWISEEHKRVMKCSRSQVKTTMPRHYFLSYQQQLSMDDTRCQGRKAKAHLHNEMGVGYLWKNGLAMPADIHVKLGKESFWTPPEEKIIRSKNMATKMIVAIQLAKSKNWNQLKRAIG